MAEKSQTKAALDTTSKMKVLVVADKVEFASTLAERLRLLKIEVECVCSGKEALHAVSRFMPDVLILDLQMSKMNGFEVLSQVKNIDQTIEVILLTERGSFEDGITCMELGAFDYMIKPVDLVVLMGRLNAASRKRLQKLGSESTYIIKP